jgi:hypothetical protein
MSLHHARVSRRFCHDGRRRRAGRCRAALTKRQPPFHPVFHGLEWRMLPSNFSVTNTNDSGAGSLRQASRDSNGTARPKTIDFSIASSARTISVLSALPSITVPLTIDGTSQPGRSGAPSIDLL